MGGGSSSHKSMQSVLWLWGASSYRLKSAKVALCLVCVVRAVPTPHNDTLSSSPSGHIALWMPWVLRSSLPGEEGGSVGTQAQTWFELSRDLESARWAVYGEPQCATWPWVLPRRQGGSVLHTHLSMEPSRQWIAEIIECTASSAMCWAKPHFTRGSDFLIIISFCTHYCG